MNVLELMKQDLRELVDLVRESATYCAQVAAKPSLATDSSHDREIRREYRIVELQAKYGINLT
jgi:hypothetical protein